MKDIDIVIKAIISHQEMVVGPLALEQAKKVSGLKVSDSGSVSLKADSDTKKILSELVSQYEKLFGKASVEVCKDAVKESGAKIDPKDLPDELR